MPSLSATLDLEAADALAVIDQVEAALAAAVDSVGPALSAALEEATASPLSIEVDDSALSSAVDEAVASASPTVTVEADTGDVQGEIESAVAEAAPEPIVVDVDTSQAQSQVEDLGSSAQGATAGLTDLGDSLGGVAGGALGAGGAIGGVNSAVAETAGLSAGATGGLAALAGGLVMSAQAGVEAASAQERFSLVTGRLSDQIRSIDVGGLNGDLGQLALSLGSDDENALNAAASLVSFGKASGASGKEVARTSDQINALALRAVALNPALGDVGDVSTALAQALARGGRAAARFQIGLSSTEINARALSDTGKENAKDLTQWEKAAAGAELATESLGNKLGTDFAEGSQNAAFASKRLHQQVGELEEQLGSGLVPSLVAASAGITPLIVGLGQAAAATDNFFGPLSEVSSHLGDDGFSGVLANLIGNGPIEEFGAQMGGGASATKSLSDQMKDAAGSADAMGGATAAAADDVKALSTAISDYLAATFNVPDAQRELRQSFADLSDAVKTGTWDDQAVALEGVVQKYAALIDAQQQNGASQDELNATTFTTIAVLAQMRDAGTITGAKFDELAAQIRGVPTAHHTATTESGTRETTSSMRNLRDTVFSIPRSVHIGVVADVAGAAQALHDIRTRAQVLAGQSGASSPGADAFRVRGVGRAVSGSTVTIAPVVNINGDASSSDAAAIGSAVGDAIAERLAERHLFVDAALS